MTLMVGRTTEFMETNYIWIGLTVWYDELKRHLKNLEESLEVISLVKLVDYG